jgi:hypothetical protein
MKPITLQIHEDGTVRGLYTEVIDLASLGRLRIQRASTIEFDNPSQLWRVFDRRGRCVFSDPSRDACLGWEQDYLAPKQELHAEG